jgi:L-rhamnonate dehydratase
MSGTEIVDVEVLVFRSATKASEFDPAAETAVVRLVDASGRTGIGEADGPAEALRELLLMEDAHAWSRGLRGTVVGREPLEARAVSFELYRATLVHGRRGLGIHALSAVDLAMYDLAGKQIGRPVHALLGGAVRDQLMPYATIYPGLPQGRSLSALLDDIEARLAHALRLGYRAVKVEVIFEDRATDRQIVDCLQGFRRLAGDDVVFMVDFGYRWNDWREALWTLARLDGCDLYFAEATLDHDDLDGHARLASRIRPRLCGAELASTVQECREWIERGKVDVLQPDLSRCGGLSELRRIADMAELRGASVIPHNWKTGITAAATCHFQAATRNAPFIEWLDPRLWDAPLRRDIVRPEPELVQGAFKLPTGPGLGVVIDEQAASCYLAGADRGTTIDRRHRSEPRCTTLEAPSPKP